MPAIRAMGDDETGTWIEPNWLPRGTRIILPAATRDAFIGTASAKATQVKDALQTLANASRAGAVVVAVDAKNLVVVT